MLAPSYGLERVSYMIPAKGHRYVWLRHLPLERLERKGTYWQQSPYVIGPGVDLVHTFNQLPLNRAFVVSAEMELPRFLGHPTERQVKAGLNRLASSRCRGIWPLSDAARAYFLRRATGLGFHELEQKVEVFRGTVPVAPAADFCARDERAPIRILFVGTAGLRKGLEPTLEGAERLRRDGIEVEVTVIGQPEASCYVAPGIIFDTHRVRNLLAQSWVTHHMALPNAEVRRLMATHDLLSFLTMDESLGWVVAEAAMSGIPTISSNVFALPELVIDGKTGWTIPLPLNEDRRWMHVGKANARDPFIDTQNQLRGGLVEIVASLAKNRERISVAGAAAHDHIENLYGIDVAAAHLDQLYTAAIERT